MGEIIQFPVVGKRNFERLGVPVNKVMADLKERRQNVDDNLERHLRKTAADEAQEAFKNLRSVIERGHIDLARQTIEAANDMINVQVVFEGRDGK